MEDTVDKFHLRGHFLFNIECLGAEWISDEKKWMVKFRNIVSRAEFVRYATILISCVGILSLVKNVPFPGREDFKGEQFHTAQWNHNYDITGKRMAIIGNGCSGGLSSRNVLFLEQRLTIKLQCSSFLSLQTR